MVVIVILRNDGGQRFYGISVDDFAVEVELFLGETYMTRNFFLRHSRNTEIS